MRPRIVVIQDLKRTEKGDPVSDLRQTAVCQFDASAGYGLPNAGPGQIKRSKADDV